MSIIINNISKGPPIGLNEYELLINNRRIIFFEHIREKGLADCLRRAADAVDKAELERNKLWESTTTKR